ncbi:MAG: flagellin [Phenylobacterium sp.]|jgi:flagellar hook-associated protein 3 FlgL|uniref:flagellin n=1 Tax=Phenylobacterium sp. TaxID=1871053 RepID=UPI0025E48A2D|nr:flagellin [Phenylobacterium sp.]MCA6297573.1 flagellin [Phenylobacterium sp.]
MTRVSTSGSYNAILNNLTVAQQRLFEAGVHVSAQKVGTDLKAYSRDAQVLTAMKSVNTRLTSFSDQNAQVGNRLEFQDLGLVKAATAADDARKAITNALSANNAAAFMTEIRGQFANAIGALNTQYAGKYVFAGGQVDTAPNSAKKLEDLTLTATAVQDSFKNDEYIDKVRVDETTTLEIGQLASKIGTAMLNAFRDIQAFQEGPDGPFSGPLTAAQKTFLQGQIAVWDSVHKGIVDAGARNGSVQTQLEAVEGRIAARQTTIGGILIDVQQSSEQDLARAATALTQAQQAVQASSQVFITLKNVSLLNFL